MKLRLFDTFERQVREFRPIIEGQVGMYACGPTVYDFAHIGNLRAYVFEDLLRRVLEFNRYAVRHVVNITDVGHLVSDADEGEDKMEKGSRRTGKSAWEIAALYTDAFRDDLKRLNVLEPTIWCRATDHIAEQIRDIQCIEEKGFTYLTSDGVYFDTSRLDSYGQLARIDPEGLLAGARVETGEKRNPTDFALWKLSPPGGLRQMEWASPWGVGFPGWHIECSAMSAKYLGPQFDIHCGGKDHIPVHHTNEIAQAQVCYGTRLANYWLHVYFLQVEDGKMAKSSGQYLRMQTLLDRGYDPLVFRYLCLSAHYRSDLSFTWESMDAAATALARLRGAAYSWGEPRAADPEYLERFAKRVNDDLNTPRALAVVWDMVRSDLSPGVKKATLARVDAVLGLQVCKWQPPLQVIPDEIGSLVQQRESLRAARRWEEADAIRAQLAERGYAIDDTPDGPKVRRIDREETG